MKHAFVGLQKQNKTKIIMSMLGKFDSRRIVEIFVKAVIKMSIVVLAR